MLNKRKSKNVIRNAEEEKVVEDNEPHKLQHINLNEGIRVDHPPPVIQPKKQVIFV